MRVIRGQVDHQARGNTPEDRDSPAGQPLESPEGLAPDGQGGTHHGFFLVKVHDRGRLGPLPSEHGQPPLEFAFLTLEMVEQGRRG